MASIKRRDNGYRVRFREGTRNKSRTFKGGGSLKQAKKDAQEFALAQERAQELGGMPVFDAGMPFRDFCMEWLLDREGELAPRTFRAYHQHLRKHVDPYIGHVPIGHLTPKRLDEWRNERLRAGAGTSSIGQTTTLLKQILKKAHRLELIARNPADSLDRPRHTKGARAAIPTPKQIEALRTWMLDRERVGDATLISVLAYAGLRPGEALGLRWGDLGPKVLHVYAPKTNTNRRVKVEPFLASDLARWRLLSEAEGFIFPRAKDRDQWTDTDFRNWRRRFFNEARKDLGLTFRPYDLRHFRASYLIALGWNVTEVAQELGHSPEVCLSTYAHVFEDRPEGDPEEWINEARRAA